jgi:hydrogenase nickel incorporation protein HypA/HybF
MVTSIGQPDPRAHRPARRRGAELLATLPLAAAGSRMEHAELEFAHAPIQVRCQTCGAETEAAMNRLICGACGDWHTQVISGDELLLESVELETTPSLTPGS